MRKKSSLSRVMPILSMTIVKRGTIKSLNPLKKSLKSKPPKEIKRRIVRLIKLCKAHSHSMVAGGLEDTS